MMYLRKALWAALALSSGPQAATASQTGLTRGPTSGGPRNPTPLNEPLPLFNHTASLDKLRKEYNATHHGGRYMSGLLAVTTQVLNQGNVSHDERPAAAAHLPNSFLDQNTGTFPTDHFNFAFEIQKYDDVYYVVHNALSFWGFINPLASPHYFSGYLDAIVTRFKTNIPIGDNDSIPSSDITISLNVKNAEDRKDLLILIKSRLENEGIDIKRLKIFLSSPKSDENEKKDLSTLGFDIHLYDDTNTKGETHYNSKYFTDEEIQEFGKSNTTYLKLNNINGINSPQIQKALPKFYSSHLKNFYEKNDCDNQSLALELCKNLSELIVAFDNLDSSSLTRPTQSYTLIQGMLGLGFTEPSRLFWNDAMKYFNNPNFLEEIAKIAAPYPNEIIFIHSLLMSLITFFAINLQIHFKNKNYKKSAAAVLIMEQITDLINALMLTFSIMYTPAAPALYATVKAAELFRNSQIAQRLFENKLNVPAGKKTANTIEKTIFFLAAHGDPVARNLKKNWSNFGYLEAGVISTGAAIGGGAIVLNILLKKLKNTLANQRPAEEAAGQNENGVELSRIDVERPSFNPVISPNREELDGPTLE